MAGTTFALSAYPWDLEDEGLDAAVARMAGEIGVDAVSITAAHPGIHELRGRPLGGRWTFQSGAAAHFQPDAKFYTAGRIRPIAAAWMKSRNPLDRIAKVAERERLKLRVSLSCCEGRELVERHSYAACVDVFGNSSSDRLCPSNPEVRAYIAALVEDVTTNYPVESIELTDFAYGAANSPERQPTAGLALPAADHSLHAWCFCASCRQRAADTGIAPDSVSRAIHDRLAAAARLEAVHDAPLNTVIDGNEPLTAYQRMRVESAASLARLIRSKTSTRIVYRLQGDLVAQAVDPAALVAPGEAVNVVFDGGRIPPNLTPELANHTTDHIEVRQRCYPPHVVDGPSLVAATHAASTKGIAAISFEDYGLMPEPCLDWVRQAIRYARRETGQ